MFTIVLSPLRLSRYVFTTQLVVNRRALRGVKLVYWASHNLPQAINF